MLTFNNKAIKVGSNNVWIHTWKPVGERTVRFRFILRPSDVGSEIPETVTLAYLQQCQETGGGTGTWTQLSDNVFDWHYDGTDWGGGSNVKTPLGKDTTIINAQGTKDSFLHYYTFDVVEADFTGVTSLNYFLHQCRHVNLYSLKHLDSVTTAVYAFSGHSKRNKENLIHVDDFAMPACTNCSYMLTQQYYLKSVPYITLGSVEKVTNMFANTYLVESGALAMYNQLSSQAIPPAEHTSTFTNCGSGTTTGAAELAQIPSDWGGTGA